MTNISLNKTTKFLFYILAVIILIYLIYMLTEIIVILALAILLAFIFSPFVSLFESHGFNRITSTSLVFGVFGFVIYFSLSIIIPKFVFQLEQLISALEGFSFAEEMKILEGTLIHYVPFLKAGDLTSRTEQFITTQVTNIFDSISTVLSSIV